LFDLKRPCRDCPFRKGVGERFKLSRGRLREIREAPAFQCHKTVEYDAFDDDEKRQGDRPQQCAGLMTVLHRIGEPNQIMQIAMRLGQLDPSTLDPEREVYATWAKVAKAHKSIL
jgi:hypothetical protein